METTTATIKRGPGRPRKPPEQRRLKRQFYLTEAEAVVVKRTIRAIRGIAKKE